MAALPDDFLTQLIAETAELKDVKDGAEHVKETDPNVSMCARIAYVQIMRHTRKPWHQGARTIYFDEYYLPLMLPTLPVLNEPKLVVTIDGEAVAEADWEIKRGRLFLYGDDEENPQKSRYNFIEVVTTCGLAKAEMHTTLYTALQLQTIGVLHRKDTFGLAETSGERGTSKKPADEGKVLDSVAAMLEGFVYEGTAYFIEGE